MHLKNIFISLQYQTKTIMQNLYSELDVAISLMKKELKEGDTFVADSIRIKSTLEVISDEMGILRLLSTNVTEDVNNILLLDINDTISDAKIYQKI